MKPLQQAIPGILFRVGSSRLSRDGFTLIEMMIALGISVAVGVSAFTGLVQGLRVFRANETEMWGREKGSKVVRRIYADAVNATGVHIYSSYLSIGGAESSYGTCVVLDLPNTGTSVAYYLSGASAGEATGGIYYDSNTATFPAPASNRLLQDRVTDLEFRRNPNGSLRIGFAAGFIGYPRRQFGTVEADLVRFSTSVTRRN